MNDLITITKQTINNEEINSVSARELYTYLGLDISHWKRWYNKNISNNDFAVEGQDYQGFAIMANGNETKDFCLTLDFAKRLAMMTRTEKGEQARQYFIECEKQLKEQNKRLLPATYKAALIELVHQLEINEQQQLTIEKQEGTIDNLSTALDSLLEWVSIIKVAKHNNVSEKEFNWRRLKAQSENMGFVIKKAASPRFGYQNLYHINVFKSCYPNYNYNLLEQ